MAFHPLNWDSETQTLSDVGGLIKPVVGPQAARIAGFLDPNAVETLSKANCHGTSLHIAGTEITYDDTQLTVESEEVRYREQTVVAATADQLVRWNEPNVIHTAENGVRSIPSEFLLNHPETQAVVTAELQKLEINALVNMARKQAMWVLISETEFPSSEDIAPSPEGNFHSFVILPPGSEDEEPWVFNKRDYGAGITMHPASAYLAPAGEHGLHIYAKPTQEQLTAHQL